MASKARLTSIGRPHITATIAPHTLARIHRFVSVSGLSKGEILDRAIDCLDVCEACEGRGTDEHDRECRACSGHRIVPSSLIP